MKKMTAKQAGPAVRRLMADRSPFREEQFLDDVESATEMVLGVSYETKTILQDTLVFLYVTPGEWPEDQKQAVERIAKELVSKYEEVSDLGWKQSQGRSNYVLWFLARTGGGL